MRFPLSNLQQRWLIALLLIGLLLPIMLATLLVVIGNASGCQMTGETAQICLVSGINIGQTIKMLVDWTWYLPVINLFHIPILSIGLLVGVLALIYNSFRGWTSALIGFFSVWFMGFAPAIAGIIFVASLSSQAQCSLNEAGAGACYLFGLNMGSTFHMAMTLPWLLFMMFPLCATTSVIYVVITLANHKQKRVE